MAALSIVRRSVHGLLESSPSFRALPPDKRNRIAHDTVRVATYMADPGGLVSREFRAPLLRAKRGQSSGVLTVNLGQTLQGGTAALDALMNGVDFPAFVAALIHGVFNAIVDASIEQMEAYAALMSDVAASVDAFVSDAISDQTARETLGREFPELFCRTTATKPSLAWRSDAEPRARPRLQTALGLRKLDPDLRHVVAAARRRLARNRQQTLATIVLMGINRIVVTDGKITPTIKFDLVRR
ncbi:MAG: hypothetical protein ACXWCO_12465 [Caldimonas sp.]